MMKSTLLLCLISFGSSAFADEYLHPPTLPGDPRLQQNANSPSWLNAVGRLEVESSDGTTTRASASLVGVAGAKSADTVTAARHTASAWGSDDSSGKYKMYFIITKNDGAVIKREVQKIVMDSRSSADTTRDWAVLKLKHPISAQQVTPLIYDDLGLFDEFNFDDPHTFASMSGYSGDSATTHGNGGKILTYHQNCRLFGKDLDGFGSWCYSYQGSSGGPVVVTTRVKGVEKHYFVSNITGGRRHDSATWQSAQHNEDYDKAILSSLGVE